MLLILILAAQLHVATPVEHLHGRVSFREHVPAAPAGFDAAAAKVFEVTARQFEFTFAPDLIINEGDSVTLNIRSVDVVHGFFLESYMTEGVTLTQGQTVKVSFIASTPGTFTYVCSIFCGTGHITMNGRMTVNAGADDPPVIAGFTPKSAPVEGGTPVLISGTNFANEAAVKFGTSNALVTVVHSSTSITAFTPAHAAGSVTITVTNPDGQSAASAEKFTFGTPRNRRRAVGRGQ